MKRRTARAIRQPHAGKAGAQNVSPCSNAMDVSLTTASPAPSTTWNTRAAEIRGSAISSPGRSSSAAKAIVLRQSPPVSGFT
jgi:hypothetical protein